MLNQALANLPLVKGCPKPDPVLLKQQLGGKAGLYSKWISRVNLPPEGIGLLPQLDTSKRVSLGRHSNQLFEGFLQGRSDQEVMRSDEEGSDENESEISSGDFDFDSSDSEDEGSSSSYSPSEDSDSSLDEAARNVRMEEMNRYFDLGSAKDKKARIAQMFLARKPPRVPQDVLMLDKLEDDPFTPAIPGSAAQPKGISKDRGGRQYMNYYGTWEKGEMHGNGGYVFADGGVYIGDFAHNRLHGQGEMAQSMATYAGMWAENKRNGSGKTQCGHGCVYEGEYVDGVRSGYGVLRLPTGVIYEGNFKHGVVSIFCQTEHSSWTVDVYTSFRGEGRSVRLWAIRTLGTGKTGTSKVVGRWFFLVRHAFFVNGKSLSLLLN